MTRLGQPAFQGTVSYRYHSREERCKIQSLLNDMKYRQPDINSFTFFPSPTNGVADIEIKELPPDGGIKSSRPQSDTPKVLAAQKWLGDKLQEWKEEQDKHNALAQAYPKPDELAKSSADWLRSRWKLWESEPKLKNPNMNNLETESTGSSSWSEQSDAQAEPDVLASTLGKRPRPWAALEKNQQEEIQPKKIKREGAEPTVSSSRRSEAASVSSGSTSGESTGVTSPVSPSSPGWEWHAKAGHGQANHHRTPSPESVRLRRYSRQDRESSPKPLNVLA